MELIQTYLSTTGYIAIFLAIIILFMYGEPLKGPNNITKYERLGFTLFVMGTILVLLDYIIDIIDWLL